MPRMKHKHSFHIKKKNNTKCRNSIESKGSSSYAPNWLALSSKARPMKSLFRQQNSNNNKKVQFVDLPNFSMEKSLNSLSLYVCCLVQSAVQFDDECRAKLLTIFHGLFRTRERRCDSDSICSFCCAKYFCFIHQTRMLRKLQLQTYGRRGLDGLLCCFCFYMYN